MSKYEPASKLCVRAVFVRAYPIWKKVAWRTQLPLAQGREKQRRGKQEEDGRKRRRWGKQIAETMREKQKDKNTGWKRERKEEEGEKEERNMEKDRNRNWWEEEDRKKFLGTLTTRWSYLHAEWSFKGIIGLRLVALQLLKFRLQVQKGKPLQNIQGSSWTRNKIEIANSGETKPPRLPTIQYITWLWASKQLVVFEAFPILSQLKTPPWNRK